MINRAEIFERVHGVVVRVELSAEGKAQSIGQNISHAKPGSSTPDLKVLHEHRVLEGPLLKWLGDGTGTIMERFHAAIMDATERRLNHLLDALAETETRLRIMWNGKRHDAMESETADELRARAHRKYLYDHYGVKTASAAAAERISIDQMRYVRRCHGIDGSGMRKEKCPEAVVQLSVHDWCAVCQVVDDLARDVAA